jgi:hypothetical protein
MIFWVALAVSGIAAAVTIVFIAIFSLAIRREEADLTLTWSAPGRAARVRFVADNMHIRSPGSATWELSRRRSGLPMSSELAAPP